MAGSVNKVILIGNLGADPEVKSMQTGDEVCNLSIATSESWNDKASGERKEKTHWHRVVIFNPNLVKVAKSYLKKGSKVYIEGTLENRSWDKDGVKQYTTEVVLSRFRGELTMLDGRSGGGANDSGGNYNTDTPYAGAYGGGGNNAKPVTKINDMDDDIPF